MGMMLHVYPLENRVDKALQQGRTVAKGGVNPGHTVGRAVGRIMNDGTQNI